MGCHVARGEEWDANNITTPPNPAIHQALCQYLMKCHICCSLLACFGEVWFLCVVPGKVFVDCLSSRYYHMSHAVVWGYCKHKKLQLMLVGLAQGYWVFFSSIEGNLDWSYSGGLNTEFAPAQLCGGLNPENCSAVVQVKTLDVKYLPFYMWSRGGGLY